MCVDDLTEEQARSVFHRIVKNARFKNAFINGFHVFLKDVYEVDDIPVYYQFKPNDTDIGVSAFSLAENTWKDALKKLFYLSGRGAVVGCFRSPDPYADEVFHPLVPAGSTFESVMIALDLKGV